MGFNLLEKIMKNQMMDWLCCGRRNSQQGSKFPERAETTNTQDASQPHSQARLFTYKELAKATQNFHRENFLGEGGFGCVYLGEIPDIDKVVAVKKLKRMGNRGRRDFLTEVGMLYHLRHQNLVEMIGFCSEGRHRLIVLEYMPKGSLYSHLHDLPPDKEPLNWDTRMKIAAGAARGLYYLHHGASPPVIFRDLKSLNILLDNELNAKLSDFGLAECGPTYYSARVMGTHGYCDPEYIRTKILTVKCDIYSFGVVLLELISGRKAGGRVNLVKWARRKLTNKKYSELADPLLNGQYPSEPFLKVLRVAIRCVKDKPSDRPTTKYVLNAMEYQASKKQSIHSEYCVGESSKTGKDDVDREQDQQEPNRGEIMEEETHNEGGGSEGPNR